MKYKHLYEGGWKHLIIRHPSTLKIIPDIFKVGDYTLEYISSLKQMYDFLRVLDKNKIEGSIAEVGCWKGGCGALMAKWSNRKVYMFDWFKGLDENTKYDYHVFEKNPEKYISSEENVKKALDILGSKAEIIKGDAIETTKQMRDQMGTIALLHIDLDVYEPTKATMEALYDKVAKKGFIVLDDHKRWEGARRAVYEFFVERDIAPIIWQYPYGGKFYIRKTD